MIPGLKNAEIKPNIDTLKERYGNDGELRLDPADHEVTECPSAHREHDGKFFSHFFCGIDEQFRTGTKFYTDLLNCQVTTLQVQAGQERDQKNGTGILNNHACL